jgi:parvulin-like peptidyl-prolyl isomerase
MVHGPHGSVRPAPGQGATHILVKDEAEIREVATKLAAGQTFAAMAKAHSKDPGSADKGGLLGWFKKDDMVKPFSDTAFATEKGQTSAPFQTRFGWHIVQIDDKRDAQPLDEVREQIVDTMSKEIVTAYIDELKAGAQIEDATAAATAGADAAKSGADTTQVGVNSRRILGLWCRERTRFCSRGLQCPRRASRSPKHHGQGARPAS